MPTSSRVGIPYPAENVDPWYDQFVSMVESLDSSIFATREDRNLVLSGGGVLSWNVDGGTDLGTFTFTQTLQALAPLSGYAWNITPGSYSLGNGHILYVSVVRFPSGIVTLTPIVGTQIPNTDDALLLAARLGTRLCLRNGFIFEDGFSGVLVSGSGGGGGGGGWATIGNDIHNTNSGNVGIGTAAPSKKLDVVGTGAVSGAFTVDSGTFYVDATNNRVGILTLSPSYPLDVAGVVRSSSGGFRFPDGTTQVTAATANYWTVATNDIYNNNSGNVGIGTTTPYFKQDLAGSFRIQGANKLYFGGTGASDNDTNLYRYDVGVLKTDGKLECSEIKLNDNTSVTKGVTFADGSRQSTAAVTTPNYWTLATNDIYSNNSGNVGIGTSTPYFKLDLAGHVRIQDTDKLYFGGTGSGDNDTNLYRGGSNTLQTDDAFVALSGTFDVGTTPSDAVILSIAAPGSAGTRNSHNLRISGSSYDTSGHEVDWRAFVNVTSNAGASTWKLQSRVDSASFSDRLSISDAGLVTVTGKVTGLTQATGSTDAVAGGRSISTSTGLSGGGDLTADRTLTVDQSFTPTWTGAHIFNPGTSPTDAVSLLIAQPGTSGTRNSHDLLLRGTSYDTGGHNADWKAFVSVTSNAGASTWTLQSRVDSGSFNTCLAVTDAGALTFADTSVMSTAVPAGGTNGYVPIWNSGTSKWVPGAQSGGTNYWTLSSSNLYNNSGTYVGINTTSPYFAVDVAGDIRVQGSNKLYFGGTGASDNDVNLYRSGANVLKTDDSFTAVNLTLTNGGGGVLTFADGTTQSTAVNGASQVIDIAFTYANMGSYVASTNSVPQNAIVLRTTVAVTIPFTGGSGPYVQGIVYNAGGSTEIIPTSRPDLTANGQYEQFEHARVPTSRGGPVRAVLTGTATAGAGTLTAVFAVPMN